MSAFKIILPIITVIIILLYVGAPRLLIDTRTTIHYTDSFPIPKSLNVEQILCRDGIKLQGLWQQCVGEEKGTIILLHGIRGSTFHFLPKMNELAEIGFNSLAIDLRGHGKSEGKFSTFGYYEKYDVQDIIKFIENNKTSNVNIGVWGQSLGGAIALQALAIEPKLKFGIIESTFADLRQIVLDYGNRIVPFNLDFLHEFLLKRAGHIANFQPNKICPKEAAKQISQPIILAHGTRDKKIRFENAKDIFNNLSSDCKLLIPVEGANHINVWEKGGSFYSNEVLKFLLSLQ